MRDFDPNVRKTDEDLDKVMHVVYLRQNKFKTYVEEDLDLSSNAIMETIVFSNENSQKGDWRISREENFPCHML